MSDWIRRRLLLGSALALVSAAAAACDSPITAPRATGGGLRLAAPVTDTAATTTSDLFPRDSSLSNSTPTTGTVTVPEPGGNATIGTWGPTWTANVNVGTDKYGFQIGVVSGSFIGIIWKNGTFAGYWGYCLFPNAQNYWYQTTDGSGKVYLHWENHELDSNRHDTGQMYHYIYDPQTNTLKVYHKKTDGTTTLIYQGPPIKTHGKLPPPDPAAGAGPYTNESQWTNGVPVPPIPTGTTTTPVTATPSTASMTRGVSVGVGHAPSRPDRGVFPTPR